MGTKQRKRMRWKICRCLGSLQLLHSDGETAGPWDATGAEVEDAGLGDNVGFETARLVEGSWLVDAAGLVEGSWLVDKHPR